MPALAGRTGPQELLLPLDRLVDLQLTCGRHSRSSSFQPNTSAQSEPCAHVGAGPPDRQLSKSPLLGPMIQEATLALGPSPWCGVGLRCASVARKGHPCPWPRSAYRDARSGATPESRASGAGRPRSAPRPTSGCSGPSPRSDGGGPPGVAARSITFAPRLVRILPVCGVVLSTRI
jgi:hypothetical protein